MLLTLKTENNDFFIHAHIYYEGIQCIYKKNSHVCEKTIKKHLKKMFILH